MYIPKITDLTMRKAGLLSLWLPVLALLAWIGNPIQPDIDPDFSKSAQTSAGLPFIDIETVCQGDTFFVADTFFVNPPDEEIKSHTYTVPDSEGMDSIVTFTLITPPPQDSAIFLTLCDGDTLEFEGLAITEAGEYTTQRAVGPDCINFILTVTVLDTVLTRDQRLFCPGEEVDFRFGTQIVLDTGTYIEEFPRPNGCDSTVILDVLFYDTTTTRVDTAICPGGAVFVTGGRFLDTVGSIADTLSSVSTGCDSIVVYDVNLLDTTLTRQSISLCRGDTFRVGEGFTTQGGPFTIELTKANGCDSTIIYDISLLDTFFTSVDTAICLGDTLRINGQELSLPGTLTTTFTSSSGCDSTVAYNLSFLPTSTQRFDSVFCAAIYVTPFGDTLRETGAQAYTLTNRFGCDSNLIYNVILLDTSLTVLDTTVCAGDTVRLGDQFTIRDDTLTQVLRKPNGCDSTVILRVNAIDTHFIVKDSILCSGDTVFLEGEFLTETGTLEHTYTNAAGCDSTIRINVTRLDTFSTPIDTVLCEGETITVGGLVFDTTGRYEIVLTAANGCDSTVRLDLEVRDTAFTLIDTTICPQDFVLFDGDTITQTGTYSMVYSTTGGCDSTVQLVVQLQNDVVVRTDSTICQGDTVVFGARTLTQAGDYFEVFTGVNGCDSAVLLDLIVLPSYDDTLSATICTGETYQLGSQTLDSSGVYRALFNTVDGCDSLVTVDLRVAPTYDLTVDTAICDNQSVILGDRTLSVPGTYTATLSSVDGCDSAVTINLEILSTIQTFDTVTICEGDVYSFGDRDLVRTGDYTATFSRTNGCDSVVDLRLRVNPTFVNRTERGICEGESYSFADQVLTEPGIYRDSFLTQSGCFAILELTLFEYPVYDDTLSVTLCGAETFPFGEDVLTQSGRYTQTFTSSLGCDSTVTIDLRVEPAYDDTLSAQLCEGATLQLGDRIIDDIGLYRDTFTTAEGCDSIITLVVSQGAPITNSVQITVCSTEPYLFGDRLLTEPGLYVDTFRTPFTCDSIVMLDLTVVDLDTSVSVGGVLMTANGQADRYRWIDCRTGAVVEETVDPFFLPEQNGTYAVELTSGGCVDTSACFDIIVTSTNEADWSANFSFFPNPVRDILTARHSEAFNGRYLLRITDAQGAVWDERIVFSRGDLKVETHWLPYGVYIMQLVSMEKQGAAQTKFVKLR